MAAFVENTISSPNHFLENIRKLKDNTLNFENISYLDPYKNEEIQFMDSTIKSLTYIRNIIQEKYFNRILNKRRVITISNEQRDKYDLNPYLAAYELLGNFDYWWLLLMVNKKMNVMEFCKLKNTIYVPDIEDIKACIIQELTKNNNLGLRVNE
jgi:hypothetical protein